MLLCNVGNSFILGVIRLRSAFLVDGLQLSELLFGEDVQLLEDPILLGIETSDGGIGEEVDLLVKLFVFGFFFGIFCGLCLLFFGICIVIFRSLNLLIFEGVLVNRVFVYTNFSQDCFHLILVSLN